MKKFRIESYEQKYMDAVVAGWNRTLVYDPISGERFMQQVVLDENFDGELAPVLLAEDEVIGFCLGVKRKYPYLTKGLEENRGWISIMFVLPEYQKLGCGQMLLNEMESRLKERHTDEITLCAYSPNYFTPGVDLKYERAVSFFDRNGYVRGTDAVSMQRNLFTYSIPQETELRIKKLREEGWSFKPYSAAYMEKLIPFVEKEFDAGWVRNVLQAIRLKEAEDTILLAVNEEDEVMGYCMRKIDGNDARFGPIGVKEELRSKGLGGILFDLQMREMQKKGIYYAYFLWTHGEAMKFYERHGMSVYRTYQLYRKTI